MDRWTTRYGLHEHQQTNGIEATYRCPCCRALTLCGRGGFEICSVCYWEDDGQDDRDADEVRGGPNGTLSLSSARANYQRHGASEAGFVGSVRQPLPQEL
ncbi:MAG: CPCC family cysteine-rich protein [Gammaproteobacteria bacterium]